jgi:hypothetical protein
VQGGEVLLGEGLVDEDELGEGEEAGVVVVFVEGVQI